MIQKLLLNIQMICMMFIKILKKYNLARKLKTLIVFDDMIADIINNEKLNPVVTELFIRGGKKILQLYLLHNHTLKCQKMLE